MNESSSICTVVKFMAPKWCAWAATARRRGNRDWNRNVRMEPWRKPEQKNTQADNKFSDPHQESDPPGLFRQVDWPR